MSDLHPVSLDLSADMIRESADTPLYQQILDLLRERIVSGDIAPGARLPAEQELTTLLGVSRITVKRALNELAASGLVRRQRGRGTVVTFDPGAPTVKASFENMIDGLTRMGLKTQVRLISVDEILADGRLIDTLDLDQGAGVLRIVRSRNLEGEPFSHLVTHIPKSIASAFTRQELSRESLIMLLDRAGHRPEEAEQSITAIAAPPEVARVLGLAGGAPALQIHRVMRDRSGKPVQDITSTYRADRFQYQMSLSRGETANWRGDV